MYLNEPVALRQIIMLMMKSVASKYVTFELM